MAACIYDAAGHLAAEQNGGIVIEYPYDKSGGRPRQPVAWVGQQQEEELANRFESE